MLTADHSPKPTTTPSPTADAPITPDERRCYWQRWNADNAKAIAHYNIRVEREGLPLAKYRSFMSCR